MGKILKKLNSWRYLGYDKEILKKYEKQVAQDNLHTLSIALPVAAVITFAELIFVWLFAISDEGVTKSLYITMNMMLISAAAIIVLGAVYVIVKNRPNAVRYSHILTTGLLAFWSGLYIMLGTCISPEDYAVIACGLFLLIQVMFNAYPIDNLIFTSCAYVLFAVLSFVNKSTMVFIYDMIDSFPFLVLGMFLSWMKSRSKWASFINADAMVQLKTQQLQNELLQSQVAIMLSQIQPHFLYNALGAISALCTKDPQKAEKAAVDFATFLRGNMDSLKADKTISFEQELNHTKNYLDLEKIRFEQQLNIVFDIKTTQFRLPTLTLQPIVENAVRYGVTKLEDRSGTVTIATEEKSDCFVITVSDDGVGFDPMLPHEDGRTHIGISNVRDRLARMCGGTIEITSTPNVGTVAVITVPKEEEQC